MTSMRKALAALGNEQRVPVSRRTAQHLLALRLVAAQRLHRGTADRHDPLLASRGRLDRPR